MTIEGKTRVQDEGARARLKEDAGLHPEGEDLDRDRGQRQIFLSILDDAFMYQQVHFSMEFYPHTYSGYKSS